MPEKKETDPFYKTKKWRDKREKILRRDGYQCQEAKRYGRLIPAETVHHIFPREEWPEYSFTDWNLISLSLQEHNAMHDRNTQTLTEKGEELRRRTAKIHGIPLEKSAEDNLLDRTAKKRRALIVGLPGAGKTTMAREMLQEDTLVFDLDHIAAAFRISEEDPHDIGTDSARRMANDLLEGFAINVFKYSNDAIIIRKAPTPEELEAIAPTEIIFIEGTRLPERARDVDKKIFYKRINEIARIAERKNINFKKIIFQNPPPPSK